MPVQYNKPTSMYVDKNSVKISEILRDRFATNFAHQDAIQDRMMSMNVAPFQKDQEIKTNLDKQTRGELESYSNRGDYENLSLPIARTARKFSNTAQVLEKNSAQYASYKEQLDKLYEDGNLDSEDYQGTLALSSMAYESNGGLKMDETGRGSNYFTGIQAIQNPDIPKRIKEALQGIMPDSNDIVQRVVGQGPNGEYEVETSSGIKTVSADRVKAALRMVMEDKSVQMYLQRKAEIRTGLQGDQDIVSSVQKDMGSLAAGLQTIDARLSKNISNDERASLEEQKRQITQSIGEVQGMIQSGNMDGVRNIAKSIEVNKLNAMYNESAAARYSYTQTKSADKQWWDDMYKQQDQQAFDVNVAHAPLTFESEVISANNPFGGTDLEANKIRSEKLSMYNAVAEELDSMGDNVTPELMNTYMGRLRSLGRDMRAFDDYTMYRYQATNPKLFKTQEYKEINKKIEAAERALDKEWASPGSDPYGSMDVNFGNMKGLMGSLDMLRKQREDFIRENAKEDIIGPEVETRVELTNAQGIPAFNTTTEQKAFAKNIDNEIKEYFKSAPGSLPVYSPNTDDLTTLADLQEEEIIPADAKYSSHGISITPPNGLLGRVLQINYSSEEGGNGSYIVPLDQTVKIRELEKHFNTEYMLAISEIARFENMQVPGMTRQLPFTTKDGYNGYMEVEYKDLSTPAVKFVMPGREEEAEYMDVYGNEFKALAETHEIRLM